MKQSLKKFLRILSRPYYWLRSRWFIWYYILNRHGRALLQANPLLLDSVQQQVVASLLKDGCAQLDVHELFPNSDHFARVSAYAQERLPHASPKTKKRYSLQLLDLVPTLTPDDPLVRLALDDKILSIANAYIGVCAKLNSLSLDLTVPVSPDAEPEESQRWHRDPEDRVMCKMFLYFTDVDASSGPLSYVLGSHARGGWKNLFPQKPPRGVYPPPGAVEEEVPPTDIRTFTGPKGMIVFCDTSGLHKGGRATGSERLASTFGYSSEAGFMLDRLVLVGGDTWVSRDLSEQQCFALGMRIPRK